MRYLVGKLRGIKDPRQAWKIKHSMVDILAICIVAVMCRAESSAEIEAFGRMREEWFRGFLELKHGIPNRLTINRVLGLIDTKQFTAMFTSIMQHIQRVSKGGICSIDGKSYMTPKENGDAKHPLYMLSAWSHENNMVLGELCVEEKHNEVSTIPALLDMLDISEQTVTIDAVGCHKRIVEQITKKRGDYVIGLKENQPTLYREMREYADCCLSDASMCEKYIIYETITEGHGRIEKREYYLFDDLKWFENQKEWKNLNGLIMVRSSRERNGKKPSIEQRYYITSLTDVQKAGEAVRAHWGIENKLHWSLDVLFREDDWLTREKKVAANLATIRKLALTFLRKASVPGMEKMSGPLKMWACALSPLVLNAFLFDSDVFSS